MDLAKFSKDFGAKLENTGTIRKDGKSMSKEFATFWLTDSLTDIEKNSFIKLTNLISSKGCDGFPNLVIVADNLLNFKRQNIGDTQYKSYEMALIALIEKGKHPNLKDISEFLQQINLLLNKDIVLQNIRTYWKVENNNFTIKYDKDFIIEFTDVNLIGYQDRDSLKIYNTVGYYYPQKKQWMGKGGTVGWERVGYDLDKIHAELRDYQIDMRTISYTADSVFFQNTMYFTEDLMGRLSDKADNLDNPSESKFPRFASYKQFFDIKNIVPGIDYHGGFSVSGKNFVGSGSRENFAKLKVYKNDSIGLEAASEAFYFDKNMIATKCRVILHLGEDSIYHPFVNFRFHTKERLVELIRTKDDLSKINYTNTYHKIYMDFTWFRWFIDKEKIEFNTISAQKDDKEATFESMNFYTKQRYTDIQKIDQIHPLEVIANCVKHLNGKNKFKLEDLITYMKYSRPQVLQFVLNLTYLGFLSYDIDFEDITVNQTTWNFLEFHRATKDSDVIQFYSKTDANTSNAELSLLNFDLKINGIPEVHLSDSQNVRIFPIDKKIVLKKNCGFTFDGTIQASQFYFYGSNYKFDYDQFMIELTNCDSLKMVAAYSDMLDVRGNPKPAIVRNKLEQINGQFFIDAPANKSGRMRYKDYPQFTSLDKTYVYYDRPDVYNGIYHRENFYFEIDPFKLVGIKGYDPDNLRFGGRLVSADIFPTIEDTLRLRKSDFSLGFNRNTTASGLPLYSGKAKYFNEIDLSNKGLRGAGKIDYLTTNFDADYLLFFPENMTGHAKDVNIKAQKAPVQYPQTTGKNVKLNWSVNKDKFNIMKDTNDFKMYDGKATIDGNLILSTNGLNGNGFVNIDNARLTSNNFDFDHHEFTSDSSEFALYTETIINLDFISKNVQSHVNFEKQEGKFKSNGKSTEWNFPKNKYTSKMNEMTWHINRKELEVNASQNVASLAKTYNAEENPEIWENLFLDEGPKFTSIHYQQDSLYFFSPKIIFDYDSLLLKAEDVKFIRVADAQIYTNRQNLEIEKEAVIRPLTKAFIITDTVERFHKIYNSFVNIETRHKYFGKGDYDFVDAVEKIKKIHFDTIFVSKEQQTIAQGKLTEAMDFSFSPHFKYIGDVKLYSQNKILEFNGATSIVHNCDTLKANWVKFISFINPKEIYIPIDSTIFNTSKNRLANGLVYTNANNVSPFFLKQRTNQYDQELLTAHGFLTYDDKENSYIISSKEKINNPDTLGNYIKFNKFDCSYYGEGKINLSRDFVAFQPNAIGTFEFNPQTDTIALDLAMVLDAYFSKTAQKLMTDKINATAGLTGMNLRSGTYEKAVYEYLGQSEADKWFNNISLGNYSKQPKELADKFIFTDIHLIWDKKFNSFLYYGPIGIANIGEGQVNKYVSGFIRIEKTRRGDIFELLLEPDYNLTYYFRYSGDIFFGLSSDENFNNTVYESKEQEKNVNGRVQKFGMGSSVNMKRFKEDMYKYFKITQ
ncbi:MAG: hypothetical protein LBV69_05745 [Bacteroidales bacterium]|jgi:hypothetical protein|nr:hypothetical protein [Bacteroidales bacterium]